MQMKKKRRRRQKLKTQCYSSDERRKHTATSCMLFQSIWNRITKYANVWSHLNLFLFHLLFFFLSFLLLYMGQKYFNSNLKVSHWKKKIRSKNLYGGLCAFALDVNQSGCSAVSRFGLFYCCCCWVFILLQIYTNQAAQRHSLLCATDSTHSSSTDKCTMCFKLKPDTGSTITRSLARSLSQGCSSSGLLAEMQSGSIFICWFVCFVWFGLFC